MNWYWTIGQIIVKLILVLAVLNLSVKADAYSKEKKSKYKGYLATVLVVFIVEVYSMIDSI
ncbi:hypothetical protein D3C87_79250 [compost metagenome]